LVKTIVKKDEYMIKWTVKDIFFTYKTPWVTFNGEYCIDENKNVLEYYTVTRVDSIIILPFIKDQLLMPKLYYRHGIKKNTLDFPGGRLNSKKNYIEIVYSILKKELNISKKNIFKIIKLNNKGWIVDSSFSTQKLYGVEVHILDTDNFSTKDLVKPSKTNLYNLIRTIECLQCRMVLIEWLHKKYKDEF